MVLKPTSVWQPQVVSKLSSEVVCSWAPATESLDNMFYGRQSQSPRNRRLPGETGLFDVRLQLLVCSSELYSLPLACSTFCWIQSLPVWSVLPRSQHCPVLLLESHGCHLYCHQLLQGWQTDGPVFGQRSRVVGSQFAMLVLLSRGTGTRWVETCWLSRGRRSWETCCLLSPHSFCAASCPPHSFYWSPLQRAAIFPLCFWLAMEMSIFTVTPLSAVICLLFLRAKFYLVVNALLSGQKIVRTIFLSALSMPLVFRVSYFLSMWP